MADIKTIGAASAVSDFTTLADHQAQTPTTFVNGNPVLHFHASEAELRAKASDLEGKEGYKDFLSSDSNSAGNVAIPVIVSVASDYLTVFAPSLATGIQIPYPSIFVHAPDGNAVMLQILHSGPENQAAMQSDFEDGDLDMSYVELRIAPGSSYTPKPAVAEGAARSNGDTSVADAVMAMYQAVSACQDLNPDEDQDSEYHGEIGVNGATEDEGFDETAPGATGWITAENMADFMDADGNLVMPGGGGPIPVIGGGMDGAADGGAQALGELGEGGERRRAAEDDVGEGEDAAKWQRTG